jgi:hypothetical protein
MPYTLNRNPLEFNWLFLEAACALLTWYLKVIK